MHKLQKISFKTNFLPEAAWKIHCARIADRNLRGKELFPDFRLKSSIYEDFFEFMILWRKMVLYDNLWRISALSNGFYEVLTMDYGRP